MSLVTRGYASIGGSSSLLTRGYEEPLIADIAESVVPGVVIPIVILDSDGNLVAGYTPAAHELQTSINGSPLADAAGTLVEIGDGSYYYQGVRSDSAAEGFILVAINHATYRGIAWAPVVGDSGIVTFPFTIFDNTGDGNLAPGCAPSPTQLQMSLNGAPLVPATGTFGEIGLGAYYYRHDVLSPPGFVLIQVAGVAGYATEIAWGAAAGGVAVVELDLTKIRVPLTIFDASNNLVPDFVPAAHELRVSRAGVPLADATGTLVQIGGTGSGSVAYYYQGTTNDAGVEGFLAVAINKTGYRAFASRPVVSSRGLTFFPFLITNGGVPATGCNPVGNQLQISLDGSTFFTATGVLGEVGLGYYYYSHDVEHVDVPVLVKVAAPGFDTALAWGSSPVPTAVVVAVMPSYANMLVNLLPPGKVWKLVGGLLRSLLEGCAIELGRLGGRVNDLLDEMDPSQAIELLPDYASELELDGSGTIEEQQARVVARLIARQRYRPVDFQTALAPLLAQDSSDVVVLERTHAMAESMGDDREVFRFFIYRDPSLPGTYYLASAQTLIDAIKPSHTVGTVIESIAMRCDDPHSLCDRDLLGA